MEEYKKVELRELKRKFRNLEQTRFLLKENGKINIFNLIGLFMPKTKEFDFSFLIQFLQGKKQVNIQINFLRFYASLRVTNLLYRASVR